MTVPEARLSGIFLAEEPEAPVRRVAEAVAVAGHGLRGDRYFRTGPHAPATEITVFAAEDLQAARRASGLDIAATDLRRNLMTRGVDVAGLVGTRFRIGTVIIEALRDNPPCTHLQELAGMPLLEPLVGRGGLRGRIVRGGRLRVGDPVGEVPVGEVAGAAVDGAAVDGAAADGD